MYIHIHSYIFIYIHIYSYTFIYIHIYSYIISSNVLRLTKGYGATSGSLAWPMWCSSVTDSYMFGHGQCLWGCMYDWLREVAG